jgi:hypothetical protein
LNAFASEYVAWDDTGQSWEQRRHCAQWAKEYDFFQRFVGGLGGLGAASRDPYAREAWCRQETEW